MARQAKRTKATSKGTTRTSARKATARPTATRPEPAARNEPAKRKPAEWASGHGPGVMGDRVTQALESGEPRETGRMKKRAED